MVNTKRPQLSGVVTMLLVSRVLAAAARASIKRAATSAVVLAMRNSYLWGVSFPPLKRLVWPMPST
jgi:hypothetical protein